MYPGCEREYKFKWKKIRWYAELHEEDQGAAEVVGETPQKP
jgi:hypothetical protein